MVTQVRLLCIALVKGGATCAIEALRSAKTKMTILVKCAQNSNDHAWSHSVARRLITGKVDMAYAEKTTVPIEKSKADIERILRKAGADQFVSGWDREKGVGRIQCKLDGIFLQFSITAPEPDRFRKTGTGRMRDEDALKTVLEKEEQRRWRGLLLVIKAKLEMIQTGQTTIQDEFMANILLPNQKTVGEWIAPQLAKAYERGTMPKLLPGG